MLLERTITQLRMIPEAPGRATELGRLGYIQWLSGLDADVSYRGEAEKALAMGQTFAATDPAVAAFCELVAQSLDVPLVPLDLPFCLERRGGAKARRMSF